MNEDDRDPLDFDGLFYINKVQHSKALNSLEGPAIIISSSGMCEAGRVLHHLKNNIEKKSTIIMFSGYQAPHTLGRRILEGADTVSIYGEKFDVKASVRRLQGTSGHADSQELLAWASEIKKRGDLKKVALVHCEEDSAIGFSGLLKENGFPEVLIPGRGDQMLVDE